MLALLRLIVVGFLVLTVFYILLSLYSRAARREKLERAWDEDGHEGDRDAFIEEGLEDYDSSLRRKLILGVYVVPVCVIMLIVYLTNFY